MAKIFAEHPMEPLTMDHLIFHTVYDIDQLKAKKGKPKPLEGIHIGKRLGVLYSQDGTERHQEQKRMLLLRRKRDHEFRDGQRQHFGLLAFALDDEKNLGQCDLRVGRSARRLQSLKATCRRLCFR